MKNPGLILSLVNLSFWQVPFDFSEVEEFESFSFPFLWKLNALHSGVSAQATAHLIRLAFLCPFGIRSGSSTRHWFGTTRRESPKLSLFMRNLVVRVILFRLVPEPEREGFIPPSEWPRIGQLGPIPFRVKDDPENVTICGSGRTFLSV